MPQTLLSETTTTSTGSAIEVSTAAHTFQAKGSTSAGTGAATVVVEVSNDGSNFITAGTITLTLGTTETSDGFAMNAFWNYVRGKVTTISGTGAKVSLFVGG